MKRNVTQASLENSLLTKTPLTGYNTQCHNTHHIIILLMLLLCLIKVETGKGQDFVKTYTFDRDHDHMIPLPFSESDDSYVIAGTQGKSKGDVRFMKVKNDGTILISRYFSESGFVKTVVDFKEYNGHYFIICLRTPTASGNMSSMEIIEVDGTGTVYNDTYLDDGGNNSYYPIHGMFYNGLLYICGYMSKTVTPDLVTYQTDKDAFIISFDPSSNNFVTGQYMSSTNTIGSTGTDYDMGVNMIEYNGDIYLTGSCNVFRPNYSIYNVGNTFQYTSGTLVKHFDAALSNNLLDEVHLSIPAAPAVHWGEHGFDIREKGGVFYLFGNYFEPKLVTGYQGFVPAPDFYHITALNPSNLQPLNAGTNARWQFAGFDYAWGLQTLPKVNSTNILMAGMLSNIDVTCYQGSYVPDWDNINPFIVDLTLDYNNSTNAIDVTTNAARVYLSNYGTGTHTLSNSYYATTDWQYNNTWSANFACQRSASGVNQNLALTAPVWGSGVNSLLNFKFIQGNQNGYLNVCTDSYTDCFADDGMNYVEDVASIVAGTQYYLPGTSTGSNSLNVSWTALASLNSGAITYAHTDNNPVVYDCPTNGAAFKTSVIRQATNARVFPNPAKDQVAIHLNGVADNVQVDLMDMLGRTISHLYTGNSEGLNQKLNLPELSTGIYILNITLNGSKLPSQKLIINN